MKYLAIVALVYAMVGCSTSDASKAELQGVWSSDVRSKGGLGTQLVFSPDGHVIRTFGAVVDFTYRIEGDKLVTVFVERDGGAPQENSRQFLIAGNTLSLDPNDNEKKQVMERIGVPVTGAHPIVGAWAYKHYTGQQAVDRYSSQGTMQLSVPIPTAQGTYSLEGRRVTMQISGEQPIIADLEGGKLIVKEGVSDHAFSKFVF